MSITLRPYQENLKAKARNAFKDFKRVIMLAPCRSRQNDNFEFNYIRFNKEKQNSMVCCSSQRTSISSRKNFRKIWSTKREDKSLYGANTCTQIK